MAKLLRSVVFGDGRRWSTYGVGAAAGLVVLVGTLYAGAPAPDPGAPATAVDRASEANGEPAGGRVVEGGVASSSPELAAMQARVERVTRAWGEAQRYYDESVAPIQRVLLRYRNDAALTQRIAVALVREANAVGLEPRLLLAVLLVENPWLDPEIRSPVGAIGMMQVMPLHRGAWPDCEPDLEDVDANICHGARIFAHYFRRSGGNIERALLRYNGCVNGTNTPNCHQYPQHVFARAGRASIVAWLNGAASAGSP